MLNSKNLKKVINITSPVFFGYISLGIAFGLYTVNSGFPWWIATLTSLLIFSGTGQYLAVALFASGMVTGSSMIATYLSFLGIELLVGLRHVFYSLSFIKKYEGTGIWKIPLIYTLTDETYAILSETEVPADTSKGEFFAAISLLDFSYWIAGSTIGAIAGNFIPKGYLNGVDFALTALFIVLMINQILASKDFVPTVVGICAAAAASILSYTGLLPARNVILTGISLGIAAMILVQNIISEKSAKEGDK